jgi:hypothetical protein
MTNYEKMMAVATPNWLAYLLCNTWICERCPCADGCPKDSVANCIKKITEHLESEVKE